VDHLTASSAEIVAGAMRDNGRAKLVGETTFGKGRIQDIVELDGGGALKFTYAEYLTPNGFALDGVGLTPDIAVHPEHTSVLDPSFNTAVETMFGISR
jgi:carboxyl-terminal processing protease